MDHMEKPKGTLERLPSKTSFWIGFLFASGLFFAFGFFILLAVMVWTSYGPAKTATTTTTTTDTVDTAPVVPTVNTNTDTADAGTQALVDSIDLSKIEANHIRGTGDVTIVEFSDADCPFCLRFHPTMQQVVQEYNGKIRWAYQHFPLTSLHPNAEQDALASECAAEQGKFFDFVDMLYITETADAPYSELNSKLGINDSQFNDCLDTKKYQSKVDDQVNWAQQLGAQGTPFSVIVDSNGKVLDTIPGALPYNSVKQQLDALLK